MGASTEVGCSRRSSKANTGGIPLVTPKLVLLYIGKMGMYVFIKRRYDTIMHLV